MIVKKVSYGQLYELLAGLNFVNVSSEERWRKYSKSGSEVMILLANCKPDLPARPADLISVRRHLVDNGVVEKSEFEKLIPKYS